MINEAIPIMPHVQLRWLCSAGAWTHSFSCKSKLPLKSEQKHKTKEAKVLRFRTQTFWVLATVYQVAAVSQLTHSFVTPYSLCRRQWVDYLGNWKPAFGHKTSPFKGFIAFCYFLIWMCKGWWDMLLRSGAAVVHRSSQRIRINTLTWINKIWQSSPTVHRIGNREWEHSFTK